MIDKFIGFKEFHKKSYLNTVTSYAHNSRGTDGSLEGV